MREKNWHQDDGFWEKIETALFSGARIAESEREVEAIISLTGIEPKARVLDLCCGIGRHSIEFARRGFEVTGVDRTAAYLARARKRARREGLDVDFIMDDMRKFCRPSSFDLAVNLFTSFGYFENPSEERQVLTNILESLRRGACLLLDLTGKEIMARDFKEHAWREEDGEIVLERSSIRDGWGWTDSRWTLLRGKKRCEVELSLRLYSAVELRGLLESCGFEVTGVYGNLEGAPYDENAERLVALARRPEKPEI